MMTNCFLLSCLAASFATVSGFSFAFPKLNPANPCLSDYSAAQTDTLLNVRLDIGADDSSHLLMDGLVVELKDTKPAKGHPLLPGANGPSPGVSSGARALKVLDDAHFIGMDGMKSVVLTDGCWEMVWREGAPAGTIVCGFNVPEDVQRNGAKLPQDHFYMSFPVWSQDGLAKMQTRKAKAEADMQQYLSDQNDEIAKMEKSSNVLAKALHYRNAIAAVEKISNSGINTYFKMVPVNDDVQPIDGGLLLCTSGTLWTKKKSFFGKEHTLLGVATVHQDKPARSSLSP